MPSPRPQAAFPFPFAEDEAQTRWWNTLHPVEQKRWFPLIRAMTPVERQDFHADRRETASRFKFAEGTPWAANERDAEEANLYARWADVVRARINAAKSQAVAS